MSLSSWSWHSYLHQAQSPANSWLMFAHRSGAHSTRNGFQVIYNILICFRSLIKCSNNIRVRCECVWVCVAAVVGATLYGIKIGSQAKAIRWENKFVLTAATTRTIDDKHTYEGADAFFISIIWWIWVKKIELPANICIDSGKLGLSFVEMVKVLSLTTKTTVHT